MFLHGRVQCGGAVGDGCPTSLVFTMACRRLAYMLINHIFWDEYPLLQWIGTIGLDGRGRLRHPRPTTAITSRGAGNFAERVGEWVVGLYLSQLSYRRLRSLVFRTSFTPPVLCSQ